jgi:hypothetical protein
MAMYNYIKKKFYEDDNITITLEEADGYLMAHVTIFSFSRSVLKRIQEVWYEICERAYWQGYEEIYTYSNEPRMFKLIKGGSEVGGFEKDGANYKVWKWELK